MPLHPIKIKTKARKPSASSSEYNDILKELGLEDQYQKDGVVADEKPRPLVKVDTVTFRETTASRKLWADLDKGWPSLAVGPAASGKTLAVSAYAQIRSLPMFVLQGVEDLDKNDLRGTVSLKDGCTVFVHSPLALSLKEENGAVFVFDEINVSRPGTQVMLLNLLQRDVNARLVIPETGETLVPNSKWRFAATMNSGYTGTRAVNEALISRLSVTEFDYLPPDIEQEILSEKYPTALGLIPNVVTVANAIRKARASGEFEFDMCLRTCFQLTECWHEMGGSPGKLSDAVKLVVLPKIGDNTTYKEQREGVLKAVEQIAATIRDTVDESAPF